MKKEALFVLSGAILAASCAHAPPRRDVAWPLPPDTPRVKYVASFAATADLDQSKWSSLKRSLVGGGGDVGLKQPMGLALSQDGQRLYIADYLLSHVLVADLAQHTVKLFAPDEPMGHVFNVALDAAEDVYVTDSQNRQVLAYSKDGKPLRAFGSGDLVRPTGLAIDQARGRVYVVDSATQDSTQHHVLVYDLGGKRLGELTAPGNAPGRGSQDGQFYFPTYVALDPAGNAYVADTLNFRVQVFDPEGKFVRAFGEQGDGPATFNKLKGLAFDGFGNLYVVDSGHGNVQIFNRHLDLLMDFGGFVPNRLEYFDIPGAIAVDPRTNRIFIANEYVARVNEYQLVNTTAADCEAVEHTAGNPAGAPANGG